MKRSTQIIVMILLVIIILVIASYNITMILPLNKAVETNDTETSVETCEHDWVVCSKYVFWTNSYKIINKCSKCGKIVE